MVNSKGSIRSCVPSSSDRRGIPPCHAPRPPCSPTSRVGQIPLTRERLHTYFVARASEHPRRKSRRPSSLVWRELSIPLFDASEAEKQDAEFQATFEAVSGKLVELRRDRGPAGVVGLPDGPDPYAAPGEGRAVLARAFRHERRKGRRHVADAPADRDARDASRWATSAT